VLASAAALGAVKVWNHSFADLVRGRRYRNPYVVVLGAPQSVGRVASISNAAHSVSLARRSRATRPRRCSTGGVADAIAVDTTVARDSAAARVTPASRAAVQERDPLLDQFPALICTPNIRVEKGDVLAGGEGMPPGAAAATTTALG